MTRVTRVAPVVAEWLLWRLHGALELQRARRACQQRLVAQSNLKVVGPVVKEQVGLTAYPAGPVGSVGSK